MARLIEVNEKLEVKKADIVVKARYKLNPLALKFVTTLIAGLKRGDDINEEYVFRVKDFKELAGLKRKDIYWAVKEAVKELLEKPLYIPDEDGFIMCNWISGGHYIESAGEVRFFIYPKLRPYLLEAQKKFLKYRLENILSLRSSYSIRLYEILKDWFEMYNRYNSKAEKIVSVDTLREILEIPQSYQYSSGIKKRILEKAKQELSENTDILFDFEEIKTGRKITHLKFYIRQNKRQMQKQMEEYFKDKDAFVRLLRKNYKGNGKTFATHNKNENVYWMALDKNGHIYGFFQGATIKLNPKEAEKAYNSIFQLVQKSPIYKQLIVDGRCLKDTFENDTELWRKLIDEIH